MRSSSLRAWYLVHRWTSLVCTLFMLLLCVTGLPLIFAHEIDHGLGHAAEAPHLNASFADARANLDAIVEAAQARRPSDAVQFLVWDPEDSDLVFVRLGETITAQRPSAFLTYDARTGAFLREYPLEDGLVMVLLRLHVDMFLGLPGTLFLGLMGIFLVASIISGAVLYGPYMGKLPFGAVRRERSSRIRWLDLHNLIGIVTMVWLLVVGATGVINTLAIPIFASWQATELADMVRRHDRSGPDGSFGSPDRAVGGALRAVPSHRMSFLAFPGNGFASSRHFVAYMSGQTPLTSRLLIPVLVDGRTGAVLHRGELPWYVTTLLMSQPLHFGDYGGLPLKIIWALLDVLSIVVLGSGVYLWLRRRGVPFEPSRRGADTAEPQLDIQP